MSYLKETKVETLISETGEVLSEKRVERKRKIKKATKTRYTVALEEGRELIRRLPSGELRLMNELCHEIDFSGHVDMSRSVKNRICKDLRIVRKTLENQISSLKKKALLIDVSHSEIEVSPLVYYKGDFRVLDQRQADFRAKCLNNRKILEDSDS